MELNKKEIDKLKQFTNFCEEFRNKNIFTNIKDNNLKFKIEKQEFFKKNKFSLKLQNLLTIN